jgi:GH25 family lysozyme M1 (1,4-beta-N-acetylmuramidase)
VIRGFDISNWQGTPNLNRMKAARAAGYAFVAIKASEATSRDPDFIGNWQTAAQAGFPVRIAYHFARPGTGAAAEAATLVAAVNAAGELRPGDNFAIDAEAGGGEVGAYIHDLLHDAADSLSVVAPFCYSGNWFIAGHLDLSDLASHHLWDATYNAGTTFPRAVGPWNCQVPSIWQHSDAENVPGFGSVDGDLFNGTIEQLAALGHGGSADIHMEDPDAMTLQHAELHVWEWYASMLRRPPESQQMDDSWAQRLVAGENPEAVINDFWNVPEHKELLAAKA